MASKRREAMAASEFALILPLLITFILAGVDFGRFATRYIAVTSAAQSGALVGSLEPFTPANQVVWTAAVRAAVAQEMAGQADFNPSGLTVTITTLGGTGDAWEVQVAVSYPFRVLIPWPGIPSETTLTQVVGLRTIRP